MTAREREIACGFLRLGARLPVPRRRWSPAAIDAVTCSVAVAGRRDRAPRSGAITKYEHRGAVRSSSAV
jgi:hypothetical protein